MYKLLIFEIMIKQIFYILLSFLISVNAWAQKKDLDTVFDESSKTFLPIPLIINNPTIGTGFGGVGLFFFKFDKEDVKSPPSIASLAGIYSTNSSYVLLASARLYWKEDKNRATFIAGPARVNHDVSYSIEGAEDLHLVYSELRSFISAEYSRKIISDFYLGLLYLGVKTRYRFDQGTEEENDFTEEFFEENDISDNFISSLGVVISWDTRDYIYNPTKGLMFSIRPKFYTDWLGSDNDYVDTDYNVRYYIPIKDKQVMAFSLAGGFAAGDVPFDGYQSYGRSNLRGYETGKFRGENMIALQAEYRRNIYNRWGAVAFAGTGSVWGNEESLDFSERTWLPSIGVGIRYMVSLKKRINLRLDFAKGIDDNSGIYFGIMEAF